MSTVACPIGCNLGDPVRSVCSAGEVNSQSTPATTVPEVTVAEYGEPFLSENEIRAADDRFVICTKATDTERLKAGSENGFWLGIPSAIRPLGA